MQPSIAMTEFATSGLGVYFMQWLKGAKWFPWLTKETAKLNRGASVVLAAITAWGISYKWSPQHASGVLGVLSVSIPTLAVFSMGAWHWAVQFVSQETIYRATSTFQILQDVLAKAPQASPFSRMDTLTLTGPAKT